LKNHKQISQIPTQNTPAISTCKRVFGEHLQHKYMITVDPEMTAAIIIIYYRLSEYELKNTGKVCITMVQLL